MNQLSASATVHAVLVSVDNTGVLITGDAGSGKSDCALQLISRGHSLVADDVVEIKVIGSGLLGSAPMNLRQLLAVRSIGIVDVVGLFGSGAFRPETSVDAVIELVGPELNAKENTGSAFRTTEILGNELPCCRLVVDSMRDMALLVETAVKILKEPKFVRSLDSIK